MFPAAATAGRLGRFFSRYGTCREWVAEVAGMALFTVLLILALILA